jgi:uncharacterized protein YdaU (DUF1376 family)
MTAAKTKHLQEEKRLEWFAWSPGDFYSMISHLPKATKHAYRDLLDHAFLHGRDQTDLPDDDELLREVVGQTASQWAKTRRRLFTGPWPLFEATGDGFFRNRRLCEEVAKAREKAGKARRAANVKWHADSEVERHPENEPIEDREAEDRDGSTRGAVENAHAWALREVEDADPPVMRSHSGRIAGAVLRASSSFSVSGSGSDSPSQNQKKLAPRARGRPAVVAHPIPDDWRPDVALLGRMQMLYPDFDLDADLGEFRAFWERCASSPKGRKSDWGLTWMRDLAAKREKRPKGTPRPDPSRFSEFDNMRTFE